MIRYTALLFAVVAVAACSSDSNKSVDTTASVSVADTTVATVAPSSTTPTTDAAIVPVNINTATDAEILRIPGVGPRMLREFKEYRPWTSIEQFRREIGKYVDKAEVARLEKYIVIK
jgi:DNA uptake protein ComE-like DNA-binding protein